MNAASERERAAATMDEEGRHTVRRAVLAASAIVVMLVSGCVHIAPYERENLARPSMDAQNEAHETAFRAHVHDAREGATGGHGSTGGGCGCN